MNQILYTKLDKKKLTNKNWFKFQFIISISILIITISFGCIYYYNLVKKENISNDLVNNYSIYRLYSDKNQYTNEVKEDLNGLFGIIEIPKIDLYYPIFATLNEELLKIAPCKFYGKTPNKYSNICIAGHNYHNSTFFSKLPDLDCNDYIYIYDNNNNKYIYTIYRIYEVEASDLSPIFNYNKTEKILTLFTCDVSGKNRIVVKAKQKSS